MPLEALLCKTLDSITSAAQRNAQLATTRGQAYQPNCSACEVRATMQELGRAESLADADTAVVSQPRQPSGAAEEPSLHLRDANAIRDDVASVTP